MSCTRSKRIDCLDFGAEKMVRYVEHDVMHGTYCVQTERHDW